MTVENDKKQELAADCSIEATCVIAQADKTLLKSKTLAKAQPLVSGTDFVESYINLAGGYQRLVARGLVDIAPLTLIRFSVANLSVFFIQFPKDMKMATCSPVSQLWFKATAKKDELESVYAI